MTHEVPSIASGLDAATTEFVSQSFEFLAKAKSQMPDQADACLDDLFGREPRPIDPILVADCRSVAESEIAALSEAFHGPDGVAHFALETLPGDTPPHHYIIDLAAALAPVLPLKHPVDHPMERHAEAVERFGPPDGTLKLYDLPIPKEENRYREQAETNELFAAHNDGLGYGGAVIASIIALDSPPAWGGFTCFQHLVGIAIALANSDREAYEALFLPDAIVALRPRGKGAIRVTSPVLYLNERSEPQAFFRISSGEYKITWRQDSLPLNRAREKLLRLAQPFAPSSTFVHMMKPGQGVIIRNDQAIHSRTNFTDGVYGTRRVLARKWFVGSEADASYKHVPGMNIDPRFAQLFPNLFSDERLSGEWHYAADIDENVHVGD